MDIDEEGGGASETAGQHASGAAAAEATDLLGTLPTIKYLLDIGNIHTLVYDLGFGTPDTLRDPTAPQNGSDGTGGSAPAADPAPVPAIEVAGDGEGELNYALMAYHDFRQDLEAGVDDEGAAALAAAADPTLGSSELIYPPVHNPYAHV